MLFYCLKFGKNIENKNQKFVRTENVRKMLLSKFSVCNSKTLKFIKEQKARGLLTLLSQIPLLGPIFFENHKMNEIKDKFSLVGNKIYTKYTFKLSRIYI